MGVFKEAATCSKDFSPSARCSTKRSETPKRKMFLQSVEKNVFRRKRKTGKATFLQLNHTLFCHLLAIARILMINDAVEEAIKQAIDQQHPKLHPPFICSHLSDTWTVHNVNVGHFFPTQTGPSGTYRPTSQLSYYLTYICPNALGRGEHWEN